MHADSMMEDELCYLKEGPEGLRETCDVVLSLDDGSQLPVHSQVIARCSARCLSMNCAYKCPCNAESCGSVRHISFGALWSGQRQYRRKVTLPAGKCRPVYSSKMSY